MIQYEPISATVKSFSIGCANQVFQEFSNGNTLESLGSCAIASWPVGFFATLLMALSFTKPRTLLSSDHTIFSPYASSGKRAISSYSTHRQHQGISKTGCTWTWGDLSPRFVSSRLLTAQRSIECLPKDTFRSPASRYWLEHGAMRM